jgi:hypothetical protein
MSPLLSWRSLAVYNIARMSWFACELIVETVKKIWNWKICAGLENFLVFLFLDFSALTLTEKVVCLIHSP